MIDGKNVIIRPLETGDEEYLHRWWNDGPSMEYCGRKSGMLMSKEAIRRMIQPYIENESFWPEERMFLICKKRGLEPLGDISYRDWNQRLRSASFGLEIPAVEERGKGYGFDVLYHFIDFMFKAMNLNRVELHTLPGNQPARRLYEKLGFKLIGMMRDGSYDSRTGTYSDTVYMDLLRREWLEIAPKLKLKL